MNVNPIDFADKYKSPHHLCSSLVEPEVFFPEKVEHQFLVFFREEAARVYQKSQLCKPLLSSHDLEAQLLVLFVDAFSEQFLSESDEGEELFFPVDQVLDVLIEVRRDQL